MHRELLWAEFAKLQMQQSLEDAKLLRGKFGKDLAEICQKSAHARKRARCSGFDLCPLIQKYTNLTVE